MPDATPATNAFEQPVIVRVRPLARWLMSFIAAIACMAFALLAAWFWGVATPRYYQPAAGARPQRYFHVTDEMVAATFVAAGMVWLAALRYIWRRPDRSQPILDATLLTIAALASPLLGVLLAHELRLTSMVERMAGGLLGIGALVVSASVWTRAARQIGSHRPLMRKIVPRIVWSGVVAVLTIMAGVSVDIAVRSEEEYVIGAVVLLGAAVLLALWVPLARTGTAEPIVAELGEVNVRCPKCHYSLVGLAELRCPECGERFTIDQLIRAQGYLQR